jgi:molybdenum-dependent DNA-binding transcriptional regulator ModE
MNNAPFSNILSDTGFPFCAFRSYIYIEDERTVTGAGKFCPGVAQLLRGVEEFGSLNKAAMRMYSKAWRIVNE